MGSKADYKHFPNTLLIDLLKGGDANAYTEILNRYSPVLINFTYRRVADLPLAEDLVHDIFVSLWEKREEVNISKGLEPFIFTAAKNRILNHFRRQKVTQKYIDNFHHYMSQEYSTADYLIRHNDLAALIEREIAALPKNMRIVFELNRKAHMDSKAIAKHLGMPENTVKSNLQRAIKILKGRLGGTSAVIFFIYNLYN